MRRNVEKRGRAATCLYVWPRRLPWRKVRRKASRVKRACKPARALRLSRVTAFPRLVSASSLSCSTTTMYNPSSAHLLRQFIAAPRRCSRTRAAPSRSWSSLVASASSSTVSRTLPAVNPARSVRPRQDRRTFVSTSTLRAAVAQKPKAVQAELVSYPSPSSLRTEEDEDDDAPEVDYVPLEEAVLDLTDRAAEVCLRGCCSMCRFTVTQPRLLVRPAAITLNRPAGSQPGCRITRVRGERRVPRISVQVGPREEARRR